MYVNCLLYKLLYANVFNAEKWPPGQFSTRVKIFFVTVLSINKLNWTYRNSWPELKMTKNNWIHCFDITTKVMFVKYRAYTNIYQYPTTPNVRVLHASTSGTAAVSGHICMILGSQIIENYFNSDSKIPERDWTASKLKTCSAQKDGLHYVLARWRARNNCDVAFKKLSILLIVTSQ